MKRLALSTGARSPAWTPLPARGAFVGRGHDPGEALDEAAPRRVVEALRRARVPYAVAGGYAVALHGAVRGTVDIDLLIRWTEKDFVASEKALRSLGLEPRLPVRASEIFRFREKYLRNRNLVAWPFIKPDRSSEFVDILLTDDLRNVKVRQVRSQGKRIRIVALEDLIRMKEAAGRRQDIEDARALRKLR